MYLLPVCQLEIDTSTLNILTPKAKYFAKVNKYLVF